MTLLDKAQHEGTDDHDDVGMARTRQYRRGHERAGISEVGQGRVKTVGVRQGRAGQGRPRLSKAKQGCIELAWSQQEWGWAEQC